MEIILHFEMLLSKAVVGLSVVEPSEDGYFMIKMYNSRHCFAMSAVSDGLINH